MAESETFKVILQGGSFGLLAIAVVWMLYYGAPMIRDTLKSLSASHESVETRLMDKLEMLGNKIDSISNHHTTQVATIVGEHTRVVQNMDANCREERLQMARLIAGIPTANL